MTSYLKIWGPFGKTLYRKKHYVTKVEVDDRIEWGFITLLSSLDMGHVILAYRFEEHDFTIRAQRAGGWVTGQGDAEPAVDTKAMVGDFGRQIPGLVIPVLRGLLSDEDKAEHLARCIQIGRRI